tara:strand:+ start:5365 stop:6333 length:969 start_codon:yes stop_codon:yes gene_type:complete
MATIRLRDLVEHARDSIDSHLVRDNKWAVCKNYHSMPPQEKRLVLEALEESDGVDFHRTHGTPVVLVSHKINGTVAVSRPMMQHFSAKKVEAKADEIAKFLSVTNKCMPINYAIAYAVWEAVARGVNVKHTIDGVEYRVVAAAYGAYEMQGYAFNPIISMVMSEHTSLLDDVSDAVESLVNSNPELKRSTASKMMYSEMEKRMTYLMYRRTLGKLGHVVSNAFLQADDGSIRTVFIDGTAWQVDPKLDHPTAFYLNTLPSSYGGLLQEGEPDEQFCPNPMVVQEVADAVAAYYCTEADSKRVVSCIRRFHAELADFFCKLAD